MAVDTLDLLAATSILTRSHTSNETKCGYFGLGWIVFVT